MQAELFAPGEIPYVLPMRCLCGADHMFEGRALLSLGRPPQGAVGMWCTACPECKPHAMQQWGWSLGDGSFVGCFAGEDEAERGGAVSLTAARWTHIANRKRA